MSDLTLDVAADGSELLTFDRVPPEPDRLAMCEWLHRHGIDRNDVAVPGYIERNVTERRVYWDGYVWETMDGKRRIVWDRDADCVVMEPRYIQLESPPMPFPALDVDEYSASGPTR